MENRELHNEALRGLAILGVVLIHAAKRSLLFATDFSVEWWLLVFADQLSRFSVPVFLMISGYYCAREEMWPFKPYLAFLQKRLARILIPYLFLSLLLFALHSLGAGQFSGKKLLTGLLTGSINPPYYFIIVIIQLYVLSPLFVAPSFYKSGLTFVFLVLITLWVHAVLYKYLFGGYALLVKPYLFPMWGIYFFLGVVLEQHGGWLSQKNMRITLLCLILLFAGTTILEFLMKYPVKPFGKAATFAKFSIFPYSLCIFLLFNQNALKSFFADARPLTWLGKYSFAIYLLHEPILTWLRNLLLTINLPIVTNVFLGVPMLAGLSVGMSVLLVAFLKPLFQIGKRPASAYGRLA